ncbi:hypothetical protein D9M70_364240 [compost metagenome]
MAHAPFDHVGDGLETAVGVRREAGDVVVRVGRAELVEHQEGVEARHALLGEDAGQVDAGTVGCGLAGALFENLAVAHLDLLKVGMSRCYAWYLN